MPTYCYSCTTCQAAFEKTLKMSENEVPLKEPCPTCGTVTIVQEFLPANFVGPINLGRVRTPAGFKQVLDRIYQKAGVVRSSKFSEAREV